MYSEKGIIVFINNLLKNCIVKGTIRMIIRTMCKGLLAYGAEALYVLASPVILLTSAAYNFSASCREDACRSAISKAVLRSLLTQCHQASAVDELDNPSIPITRQAIIEYYASRGRYLTWAEIDEFTRFSRYSHVAQTNSSRQKILPYILGEYTDTPLESVYVANDDMIGGPLSPYHPKKRTRKNVKMTRLQKFKKIMNEIFNGGCHA